MKKEKREKPNEIYMSDLFIVIYFVFFFNNILLF
jgi:hypothetical protein